MFSAGSGNAEVSAYAYVDSLKTKLKLEMYLTKLNIVGI